MPAAVVVAALVTVLLGRVVTRRKDRVDMLDKQQQMLERQLRIEEAQERQADRCGSGHASWRSGRDGCGSSRPSWMS
jgi:hypothetical protein